MSVKVMGLIWDTDLKPTLRYVLLAYADHADHEGKSIFPSVKLVAHKTGYSKRTVQSATRELEQIGWLIRDGTGPKGTNRWMIPLDIGGAGDSPPTEGMQENAKEGAGTARGGVQLTAQRGAGDSSEPLKNHHINHQESLKDSRSTNDRKRKPSVKDKTRKAVAEYFSSKTGLKVPDPKTVAQKKAAGAVWYAPIREICDLVDWNLTKAKGVIDMTLDRLDGMTVANPNSIIKTSRAIIAEEKIGKGSVRQKEPHEMTDAEFSAYLKDKP